MMTRLHAILDTLPPRRRVAFVLFEIEGHSIEAVAHLTGTNRAVAKSRIWFARQAVWKLAHRDPWLKPLLQELSAKKGATQ
jgi:DNA-directed RNA polymerase specialized sigma24 family protein